MRQIAQFYSQLCIGAIVRHPISQPQGNLRTLSFLFKSAVTCCSPRLGTALILGLGYSTSGLADHTQESSDDMPGIAFNPAALQFANVDATLYGADAPWRLTLNDNWRIDGVVSYVRGKRADISDNLYRIAPLNGRVTLTYRKNRWWAATEGVAYADQNKVSKTNNDSKSDGYALMGVKAGIELARHRSGAWCTYPRLRSQLFSITAPELQLAHASSLDTRSRPHA